MAPEPHDLEESGPPATITTPPAVPNYFVATDPAPAQPRIGRFEVMAVALIAAFSVAGVFVGALWPHPQVPSQSVRTAQAEGQPSAQETHGPAAEATAHAKPEGSAAVTSTLAPPRTAAGPRPGLLARTSKPRRTSARVERKVHATPERVAQASPAPAVALPPAPVATPPPPAVAPQPRATAAIEVPTGRFFQTQEVDQAPRVATRVEPQLPVSLAGRHESDVVVIRLLVSQTGHPFRLNLLRRSRMGAPADDAVIAAVKQWTFSPARNHGEAVACWLNVGVALPAN